MDVCEDCIDKDKQIRELEERIEELENRIEAIKDECWY